MNKKWAVLIFLCSYVFTVSSQTLFSYGKFKVDTSEFLRAYTKNNSSVNEDKKSSIQEYLELYINSRLKVREAYDRKMDMLPTIKEEVENLRKQIIDHYLSDNETLNKLSEEAFQRSQKDIHVSHIYIGYKNNLGLMDSVESLKKINAAYQQLQQGKNFADVAIQFSEDPSVKQNKGDIGWITVFGLPYLFENAIYNLQAGNFSQIIRSKSGYHIFKNNEEHAAMGKIKASQILFAFPPEATDAMKQKAKQRADSVYSLLVEGGDFLKLAEQNSNDVMTATKGGQMTEFGTGSFTADFEKAILAIHKKDAVSKPILTSHGYHIVKFHEQIPVAKDFDDKKTKELLKQEINQSDRKSLINDALVATVIKNYPVHQLIALNKDLWDFTDSTLSFKPAPANSKIKSESTLLKIGKDLIPVDQWVKYAEVNLLKQDGTGRRPYMDVANDFNRSMVLNYYSKHLEDFNPDFRFQMKEFEEGNLFFEIMQDEVWGKSQNDSAQLKKLFAANKTTYNWQASADAIVFFSNDIASATEVYNEFIKHPEHWQEVAEKMNDKTVADSGRFEFAQIPNKQKEKITVGLITKPEANPNDNTASFAYILKLYPNAEPRTYAEAKALVMNDYQNELEKKWILTLKKKYPVTVDQNTLNNISK